MKIASAQRTQRLTRSWRAPDGRRLRLELIGDPQLFEHAPAVLQAARDRARDGGEFTDLAHHPEVYLKGGRLGPWSGWRHGLRARLLRANVPRRAEFETLEAWRTAGFEAPRPLLAAVAWSRGRPVAQALATERVERAGGYRALLEDEHSGARAGLLAALARTLGDAHASGLFHGDLYPRNVLYREGGAPRPIFLDMRQGPERRGVNGERRPARDLGCFFLHASVWCTPAEQRAFFIDYTAARSRAGAPVELERLGPATARAWARERRRFIEAPERHRDLPRPLTAWTPPID